MASPPFSQSCGWATTRRQGLSVLQPRGNFSFAASSEMAAGMVVCSMTFIRSRLHLTATDRGIETCIEGRCRGEFRAQQAGVRIEVDDLLFVADRALVDQHHLL